ncbi:MAG: TniQ family protein [Nitrospirae bacterium]|nr:TniQ family protein [Nitrospirota bacterium]
MISGKSSSSARLSGGLSSRFEASIELAYKVKSYRFDLDKQKFRYRVEPKKDELLSSWIVRVALVHLTDPATFVNLYLPAWRNILWTRDIDIAADNTLLDALAMKSGIEHRELYNHTIRAYEGYLSETINPKTRNPFVQSLKSRGRVKLGYGIRFCPKCLQKDAEPYFRRKWRLSFSTACVTHNCFLLDRCPYCGTPVTLCRSFLGKVFPVCSRCRLDFRTANSEDVDQGSYGLEAIRRLYEILDTGMFRFVNRYAYSFLFFRVLRQFVRITKFQGYIRGLLNHEVLTESIDFTVKKRRKNIIDYIPIREQYLVFSGLMKLFENYPQNFLSFCSLNHLRFTDLCRDIALLPFWYAEVVDRLNRGGKKINIKEVRNAIAYLSKKQGWTCKEHVSKIMGVYLDYGKTKGLRELFYSGGSGRLPGQMELDTLILCPDEKVIY